MLYKTANANLQPLHTLGFAAQAQVLVTMPQPEAIHQVVELAQQTNLPIFPLGAGSNLILAPQIQALVVRQETQPLAWPKNLPKQLTLEVPAGYSWPKLVQETTQLGYFGIENLALIPGQAGAAPVQNIGAYGIEAADCLEAVSGFWLDTNTGTARADSLAIKDCQLGYRSSRFKTEWKNKFFITSIHINLNQSGTPNLGYADLEQRLNTVLEQDSNKTKPVPQLIATLISDLRRSKLPDPKDLANAGSFFTNPVVKPEIAQQLLKIYPNMPNYPALNGIKLAAGWLIEQCGLKGWRSGQVGVHAQQALVLVHYGSGKVSELLNLAELIQAQVYTKFGVRLEFEPELVGFD